MIGPSKTHIHYRLSLKSWTKLKAPNSSLNLMSDGVTITSGLFEPTVMFFGMCNSPATFQAMMDSIFSDMIEKQKVVVYMDNILIFAENQEELQERTKQVLQRLQEHNLFLKPKKCEFNKSTMEYLGLIIQEGKLSMDPVKLSRIRDWPTPTSVKQV
jgi:Reverse transcriptase (RNA-dependent DNA polymerase)